MVYCQDLISLASQLYKTMMAPKVILDDRSDTMEDMWRRLQGASQLLGEMIKALSRSLLARQYKLKDKLAETLDEAREIKQDLDESSIYLRSAIEMIRMKAGLEESRRSIEMAELSIEESKRVKLLTMLAFIFIPLSLSTSVFGMNIQQINQTGPSWWIVVVTAMAMVAAALVGWYLANRSSKVYRHVNGASSRDSDWRVKVVNFVILFLGLHNWFSVGDLVHALTSKLERH